MFQVVDRLSGSVETVYAVHRSDAGDEAETWFLVWAPSGWRWLTAERFLPPGRGCPGFARATGSERGIEDGTTRVDMRRSEQPAESSAEQPAESSAEQPAESSVEQPESSAEQPAESSAEQSAARPAAGGQPRRGDTTIVRTVRVPVAPPPSRGARVPLRSQAPRRKPIRLDDLFQAAALGVPVPPCLRDDDP